LGEPLDIGQIAALTGCSPWTVRLDAHAERASPFRFSASGRLTFYKNQVTSWIVSGSKKVVDSILERLWSLRDLAEATPTAWPLLLVRSSRKFPLQRAAMWRIQKEDAKIGGTPARCHVVGTCRR